MKNDSDSEFEVSEKELKEARAAELDADVDYDHSVSLVHGWASLRGSCGGSNQQTCGHPNVSVGDLVTMVTSSLCLRSPTASRRGRARTVACGSWAT